MATIDLGKVAFVFKGTYNAGTTYENKDAVAYTDSGETSVIDTEDDSQEASDNINSNTGITTESSSDTSEVSSDLSSLVRICSWSALA